MEVILITLKKNQIKLKFENVNSISIKDIKQKLEDKYGFDKNITKIMKDKKVLENNIKISNNETLDLKYYKYIPYKVEIMEKKQFTNFGNFNIFDENDVDISKSVLTKKKTFNENDYYNDFSIYQKQNSFPKNEISESHNNFNSNSNKNYNNDNYNIPSSSNRNNLEFSVINNDSDNDVNTGNNNNNNNNNSNNNSNSNNNYIVGQYDNENMIRGENDNIIYDDSTIMSLMEICNTTRDKVISALKKYGEVEIAIDILLNGAENAI